MIQNLAQEELTLHAKAHHLESIAGRSKRILTATCKGSAICYASMCFSFLEFLQLRSKPYQYGTVITEVPPRFLAPNQLSSRAARGGGTFCQTAGLTPEPLWIIPLCLVLVLLHGETWPFLHPGRVAVLRSLSCGGRRCFVRLLTFSWS